jgi:hypothetical protein
VYQPLVQYLHQFIVTFAYQVIVRYRFTKTIKCFLSCFIRRRRQPALQKKIHNLRLRVMIFIAVLMATFITLWNRKEIILLFIFTFQCFLNTHTLDGTAIMTLKRSLFDDVCWDRCMSGGKYENKYKCWYWAALSNASLHFTRSWHPSIIVNLENWFRVDKKNSQNWIFLEFCLWHYVQQNQMPFRNWKKVKFH